MELKNILTVDINQSTLHGRMKKYQHFALRVLDNLIPNYTRGGYHFNGGFEIKTFHQFNKEQKLNKKRITENIFVAPNAK